MKIVLHVGLPKAASTSLQVWLRAHRAELGAAGVHVPVGGDRADRHHPGGRTPGHDVLARLMHWPWALGPWLDRFAAEARAAGAGRLVLSAENLSHPANIEDLPRFARALARHLARRPGWSLEVVLVTRAPEAWLASFYNEAVLDGRSFETRSFARFAADMAARGLSPEALAATVERCFPGQVRRVALDDAGGGALFEAVAKVLGIAPPVTRVAPQRVSPTAAQIEAQRQRNAALRARPWRVGARPRTLLRVILARLPHGLYHGLRRAARGLSSFVAFAMLARRPGPGARRNGDGA